MDRFEHLALLIQFGDKAEGNSLSQSSPFFANSDPDMPAAPVPAGQVHDWLMQNIASSLEHISERTSTKENGPASATDQDVAMTDASTVSVKVPTSTRGSSFIEGISKSSYVKHASDIKGSSVKVCFLHAFFPLFGFLTFFRSSVAGILYLWPLSILLKLLILCRVFNSSYYYFLYGY